MALLATDHRQHLLYRIDRSYQPAHEVRIQGQRLYRPGDARFHLEDRLGSDFVVEYRRPAAGRLAGGSLPEKVRHDRDLSAGGCDNSNLAPGETGPDRVSLCLRDFVRLR